tara:strand:- start:2830 stop:3327 length:498 start_codon:yes stop_codon:yes gene_type:complete
MDKVITVGLLTIAGVITASILFFVMSDSIDDASTQSSQLQSEKTLKDLTEVEIINVMPKNLGSRLDVWVKNHGVTEISLAPINKFEFFLTDVDGTWGEYIDHSDVDSQPGVNTWMLIGSPDRIWAPGETIQFRLSLLRDPVQAGNYHISINTPTNITARFRFNTN